MFNMSDIQVGNGLLKRLKILATSFIMCYLITSSADDLKNL